MSNRGSIFFTGGYVANANDEERFVVQSLLNNSSSNNGGVRRPQPQGVPASSSSSAGAGSSSTTTSSDSVPAGTAAATAHYALHAALLPYGQAEANLRHEEERARATHDWRVTPEPLDSWTLDQLHEASRQREQTMLQALERRRFVDRFQHTVYKLNKDRICQRCRGHFCLLESIGAWQCRFHPGVIDERTNSWSCCKKVYSRYTDDQERTNTMGAYASACTPVDHTDMYLNLAGVRDGAGAWSIPPEIVGLFPAQQFRHFYEPHRANIDVFSDVWQARSKHDVSSSSASAGTREAETTATLENRVRYGEWAGVEREYSSRYAAAVDKNSARLNLAEDYRKRARRHLEGGIVVATSPIVVGPQSLIGTSPFNDIHHAFYRAPLPRLDAARLSGAKRT